VQITCCYENFCDKHIKEEIMKNFTCPNCKAAVTLRDLVPNKKLRENICWFRNLLSESVTIPGKLGGAAITAITANTQQISQSSQYGQNIQISQCMTSAHMPSNIQVQSQSTIYHGANIAPIQSKPKLTDFSQGKLEKLEENKEADMTPEEKMQLFHRKNEPHGEIRDNKDSKLLDDSQRKQSEEIIKPDHEKEKSIKSIKSSSDKKSSASQKMGMHAGKIPSGFPYPMMPHMMYYGRMPMPTGGMPQMHQFPVGMNPMPSIQPMTPLNPATPMNPMFYHMPPIGGYPFMYPQMSQPGMKKPEDEDKSRSSSNEVKKKKRSKDKSRSRSRSRKKSKKDKDRNKERDRKDRSYVDEKKHREKEREREKDKDREKERDKDKNKNKKYK
jgi:hypothetical protein